MLAFGRINIFGHLYYGRPAGGRETREINDKFDYGGKNANKFLFPQFSSFCF